MVNEVLPFQQKKGFNIINMYIDLVFCFVELRKYTLSIEINSAVDKTWIKTKSKMANIPSSVRDHTLRQQRTG